MHDTSATLATYATAWLHTAADRYRPATLESYRIALERHALPRLGDVPVPLVTPAHVRQVLVALLADGLAPRTVKAVQGALSTLLAAAEAEGLRTGNPARRAAHRLQLGRAAGEPLHLPRLAKTLTWRPKEVPPPTAPALLTKSPHLTVVAYATHWLAGLPLTRKPTTTRRYEQIVRHYIAPAIGALRITDVTRSHVHALLGGMLEHGRAVATVRSVVAVLGALFAAAVEDDELLKVNPCRGVARRLRLGARRRAHEWEVPALTAEEVTGFLDEAWRSYWYMAPLYEVYARAGLRLGEGLALQPGDILPGKIRVERNYTDRMILTPKSGPREVQIGPALEQVLAKVPRWPDCPWLFPSLRTAGVQDPTHVGRTAQKIARRAGVPPISGVHTLRHSWASIHVAAGAPLEWVSRQLGHQAIAFTVSVYGRHLEMMNVEGLARFDALLAGEAPASGPRPGGRRA